MYTTTRVVTKNSQQASNILHSLVCHHRMPLPPRTTYRGRRRVFTSDLPSSDASSLPSSDTIVVAHTPPSSPPPATKHIKRVLKPRTSSLLNCTENKVQTHLALSKRPQRTTCSKCGMSYDTLSPGDLRTHARFHSRALIGVGVIIPQSCTPVHEFPFSSNGRAAIYKFTPRELAAAAAMRSLKSAVDTILELCNIELSAPNEHIADLIARKTADLSIFVCVSDRQNGENGTTIIGICLVERAVEGYYMSADSGRILSSKSSLDVVMGISRIYTVHSARRMGVARALLEAARNNYIYGMQVSRQQVAWSQPSQSGCSVATAWCSVELTEDEVRQDRGDQVGEDVPGGMNVKRKIIVYVEQV